MNTILLEQHEHGNNMSMACTYNSWCEQDDTSTSMHGGRHLRSHGPTYSARRLFHNHKLTIMIITRSPQDQPSSVSTIPSWSSPDHTELDLYLWSSHDHIKINQLLFSSNRSCLLFRLLFLLTHSVTYYELCPWPRTWLSIDYTLCRG